MRVLGLLGGMSWESTVEYYRLVNEETRARLGGLHSAPLLLWSADFADIERMQAEGRWDDAAAALATAARALEAAGAEGVVLGCTEIEPLVHPEDTAVPLFPSTALHARAAVDVALAP